MEDTTLPQVLPKTLKKKIKKRIVTTNDEIDDSNSVNSNIGSKTLNLISQTTLLNPPIAPFSSNPIISKLQKMIDSCESDSSDEFTQELPKPSPIIIKKIITTPTLTLTRQQYFDNYNKILKQYWGYDTLKPEQFTIINTILEHKRDVCAVLATGFGKSICYQLPALISNKCVIIISPLIALMKDQHNDLIAKNIPVCSFNSETKSESQKSALISGDAHKIIFMTPEYFIKSQSFITDLVSVDNLAFVAIDEAHAISTWGNDFRSSYVKLSCIKEWIPEIPILTLTATASIKVKLDIKNILSLKNQLDITGSFDRPNLYISVHIKESLSDTYAKIKILLEKYKTFPSIIYCSTRDETEAVATQITALGIPASSYHAGMNEIVKNNVQVNWTTGVTKCIVATIAFGMGINVSNVRLVVHFNCPKNIENYYQEMGRAGRDGVASECHLFFSPADFRTNRYFIDQIKNVEHKAYQEEQTRLIERYVYSTECRRKSLLLSFGQIVDSCTNCDNCLNVSNTVVAKQNYTNHAYLILSTISRVNESYGGTMILNIVMGLEKKVKDYMLLYDTFGEGAKLAGGKWWILFMQQLVAKDLIVEKKIENFFGTKICLTANGKKYLESLKKIGLKYSDFIKVVLIDEQKFMLNTIESVEGVKAKKTPVKKA